MDHRAEIDTAIARFEQFARRDADRDLGALVSRPAGKRSTTRLARRISYIAIALAVLFVVTIGVGLAIDGIGMGGLFVAAVLMLGAVMLIGFWPAPARRPVPPYREDMPNQAVVRRLATMLDRHRSQLPPGAGSRVDAIGTHLPLIESRLSGLDPLDPLAQDARRLMGEHLPELIERYERVPPRYRRERDADGVSVDQRLVSGLDAARAAIDDLGRRLAEQDVSAFETQGRFLESRYREDEFGSGSPR